MTFKIGDKVRLIDNELNRKQHGGSVKDRLIFKIMDICDDHVLTPLGWYHHSRFELAEPPALFADIKVGDMCDYFAELPTLDDSDEFDFATACELMKHYVEPESLYAFVSVASGRKLRLINAIIPNDYVLLQVVGGRWITASGLTFTELLGKWRMA
jgi:hypothetical protein